MGRSHARPLARAATSTTISSSSIDPSDQLVYSPARPRTRRSELVQDVIRRTSRRSSTLRGRARDCPTGVMRLLGAAPADAHAGAPIRCCCRRSSAGPPSLPRSPIAADDGERRRAAGADRAERQVHRRGRAGRHRRRSCRLRNLRKVERRRRSGRRLRLRLTDRRQRQPIARFAWTPKRPGAEIVHSVIPVHRGRARRLRAAGRPGAALHAPHRRDHRRRREPAALSRAARSAVRPAQPHLLRRAAGRR